MRIWIDNDACPKRVREIIFKGGKRLNVKIIIVANSYMHPPPGFDVEVIVVGDEFDAADNYIAENVQGMDLVITSDVPLADRVIQAGALAISARGRIFTPESIKEALAMRNLSQELRSGNEIQGGPKALDNNDINRFAAGFDKLSLSLIRKSQRKASS